jgi:putative photosynthetic complex assembly protein
MSSHVHHDTIPRAALLAAGAMIVGTIVLAAVARSTGLGTVRLAPVAAVTVRELRFLDAPDGSVAVLGSDGAQVAALAPGTNGFARGVLRGLARERRREGIGTGPAFRLTRWADGRLTLDDPTTARHVDLDVFGPTNAAAFARLLDAPGADRPPSHKDAAP